MTLSSLSHPNGNSLQYIKYWLSTPNRRDNTDIRQSHAFNSLSAFFVIASQTVTFLVSNALGRGEKMNDITD